MAFDDARHDDGAKRLLGSELPAGLGKDEVERVIALVCDHPATARFIARHGVAPQAVFPDFSGAPLAV